MELVKENVTVNQVSCKGDTQVLVDEDIIVPDVTQYRVLRTRKLQTDE